MAARRSRIKPELMEALQMLKFSVKKGRGLDFTTGLGWEAELDELAVPEGLQELEPPGPDIDI